MAESRKEKLAKVDHWGELLALRDRQREQMKGAIQVVRDADLPQETNRQEIGRAHV